MSRSSLPLGALALAIAGLAYVYVDGRSAIVEKQTLIEEAWEEAAAVIAERSEQVLPLAMTIRSSASGKGQLLQDVLEARAELGSFEERPAIIAANMRLSDALAKVLAAANETPTLQQNPDFTRLQDQLAATENDLAAGRRRYNQAVQDYNTSIQLFPSNFIAGLAGYVREEAYFRTTEETRQAPPPVKFSQEAPQPETEIEE